MRKLIVAAMLAAVIGLGVFMGAKAQEVPPPIWGGDFDLPYMGQVEVEISGCTYVHLENVHTVILYYEGSQVQVSSRNSAASGQTFGEGFVLPLPKKIKIFALSNEGVKWEADCDLSPKKSPTPVGDDYEGIPLTLVYLPIVSPETMVIAPPPVLKKEGHQVFLPLVSPEANAHAYPPSGE